MRTAILSTIVLVAAASTARAQYNYNYESRASTVGESYARGMSDLISSAGVANVMNSEAAKNYQQARSMDLDNRQKYAETYFEMKRINRESRENMNPRPSSDQLFRAAKQGVPSRLSPSELDPLTGDVNWPRVLTADVFKSDREQLEKLYQARANGQLNYDQYQLARETTQNMIATLVTMVEKVPPQDYVNARSFLTSLRYETTAPQG